jgi:hypothetical protein
MGAVGGAVDLVADHPEGGVLWTPTKSGSIGFVKLGQPVPLSNLSRLSKRGVSLHTEK